MKSKLEKDIEQKIKQALKIKYSLQKTAIGFDCSGLDCMICPLNLITCGKPRGDK